MTPWIPAMLYRKPKQIKRKIIQIAFETQSQDGNSDGCLYALDSEGIIWEWCHHYKKWTKSIFTELPQETLV